MTSGFAALPRRGAIWNAVSGSSTAVILYEREAPFLIPCGSLIVQVNSPPEPCPEQAALVALIPGPARMTRTCLAVPITPAMEAGIALPLTRASLKVTLTCPAETATVLPGLGELNPANRKAIA